MFAVESLCYFEYIYRLQYAIACSKADMIGHDTLVQDQAARTGMFLDCKLYVASG